MKHIITILCFVMLSMAGTQNAQAQTKANEASVNAILNEITEVLNNVEIKDNALKTKNISIGLETTITKGIETNLDILIVKIGGSKNNTLSNKTTFNFDYKQSDNKSLVPLLSKNLKKVIESAYNQLSEVNNEHITTKKITVEVSFVIEKSGSVEGKFVLVPVTISAKGSLKKKAVHSIKIDFE